MSKMQLEYTEYTGVTASSRLVPETKMRQTFGKHYVNLRDYIVNYGLADAVITPTTADTNALALGSMPPIPNTRRSSF